MNTNIISIQNLLKGRNADFDKAKKIKLVRHLDNRTVKHINGKDYTESVYMLYRYHNDLFDAYQNEQKTVNFKDVEYIVSFVGEEKNTARFIGVYKNCNRKDVDKERSIFDFRKIDGFEVLEKKVVVEWGGSSLGWHQWWHKNPKNVIRIDRGITESGIPVFSGYENVLLSFEELKSIFQSKEWHYKLEACNGIYMILDKSNGKQYIGSTYTNDKKNGNGKGIWKRWLEYAETGHGGNKSLEELCKNDPNYPDKNFQWCILETLPLNVTELVAVERESFYKRKFGTMEPNGYNNN